MSQTEIFRLGRNPEQIGEVRNAWKGAMFVWNEIARTYFYLANFPMFDETKRSLIWNADATQEKMPLYEKIVLRSTMDTAVVYGRDIPKLIEAFEEYAQHYPNSSYHEQAEILRGVDIQPDDLIAWNQNNVCGFWGLTYKYTEVDGEEIEEEIWYNPATGNHFDIFKEE